MMRARFALAALAALTLAHAAHAWTRPGHMVTAAIAYDEIAAHRPELLEAIAALLDAHPDRGAFEVSIDRTTGAERARRMFLECARWPDDARRTVYDHPTWHGVFWPVIAPDADASIRARAERDAPVGQGIEAFALNYQVLGETIAAPGERAVALCWVLHVAGDIHQPFHAAQEYSLAYPEGDAGAGRRFVLDPLTNGPISLHWLWDDAVHRSGVPASVDARAREITTRYPRASLSELRTPAAAAHFPVWAREESYRLAASFAYGAPSAATPEAAPAVPEAYWREVRTIAERRVAIAGYRMADLVVAALSED